MTEHKDRLEGKLVQPTARGRRLPRIMIEGESGQVIVLIALLVVVLLGFTALAIDGGGLFLLQRDAQNAADAAALAGAYAKCTGGDVAFAAEERAALDGFNDATLVDVRCNGDISCEGTTTYGSQYVQVIITADKPSYFAHLIYGGPLRVTVQALGECLEPFDPDDVKAIVSLAPCSGPNACPSTASPTLDSSGSNTSIDGGILGGCGCEFTGSNSTVVDGVSCVPPEGDPVYGSCSDMGANWPHGGGSGNATCPDGGTPNPTPEEPVDPFEGYWETVNFDDGGIFARWAQEDDQCAGNTVPGSSGRWPNNAAALGDPNPNDCYTNLTSASLGTPDVSNMAIQNYYFEGLYYIETGDINLKTIRVGPAGATFVIADPVNGRIRIQDIEDNNTKPYDAGPILPSSDPLCNVVYPVEPDPDCFDPGPNQLPLAFANVDDDTCSTTTTNAGFSINGSSVTWSGIVYVPYAGCNWSGSSQTVYGAYVCRSTELSSSNSEIIFDPSNLPTVPPWLRYGLP